MSIRNYAAQFVGSQQPDAQELMMLLLGVLHKELKRVQEKTYIELNDADAHRDEVSNST
ncbi:unnamed protein product [Dibothriocephalus latus]|uniref:Uncharacterized protein n=1 Tax=Dibothriocephalus latus TaxID=60516 RepID=A0A3P7MQ07_DIBLA|nr:unnamed protein product [Dibothriocephalus latus]